MASICEVVAKLATTKFQFCRALAVTLQLSNSFDNPNDIALFVWEELCIAERSSPVRQIQFEMFTFARFYAPELVGALFSNCE